MTREQPTFTTYRYDWDLNRWVKTVWEPFRPTNVKMNEAQRKYKTQQGIMTRAALRRKR